MALVHSDRKFDPALFVPPADGDGVALIQRCRALRRDYIAPALARWQWRLRPSDLICSPDCAYNASGAAKGRPDMKSRARFLSLLKHDILKLDLAELSFGV